MKLIRWPSLHELRDLLRETAPALSQQMARLRIVEKDIILPVKAVAVGIMAYSLYHTRWFEDYALDRRIAHDVIEQFFLVYVLWNSIVAGFLLFGQRMGSLLLQRLIFTANFLDGLFLTALVFVTGGFDSTLYWLFLALIVRNALSLPLAMPQLLLNFLLSFCFIAAGALDLAYPVPDEDFDDMVRGSFVHPAEPFALRLIVLWLTTVCCYGVQVLFERQRQAVEEAREFATRQQQLSSAGHLAAKIAHQIKNPLAIINNATFSLQRAMQDGKLPQLQQVGIIREEVERADHIITKLMGYAQLAEGKVEKLDLEQALDLAIRDTFPPGAHFNVSVYRHYEPDLPPMLMQRAHLNEVLVNLLTNAREAMGGNGTLTISAKQVASGEVLVEIQDSGPGIEPHRLGKIFDPYFSTKEKGTGLGLSIVRHNMELYGGRVDVESPPGQGARFILLFPTRTFMK